MKIHMRGRDGLLNITMDEKQRVVMTFDGQGINDVISLPPYTVALKGSDKWDLVREKIVEIPLGSLGNMSLCKLKLSVIQQLQMSQKQSSAD